LNLLFVSWGKKLGKKLCRDPISRVADILIILLRQRKRKNSYLLGLLAKIKCSICSLKVNPFKTLIECP